MGLYLGLANGDMPRLPHLFTPELVRGWADRGLRCLAFGFPLPHAETAAAAPELKALLDDHGIHVSQFVGINAHLASVDPDQRAAGIQSIVDAIPAARALDATMMQSGVGTNATKVEGTPHHHYAPHALNYSAAARDGLVDALRQIATIVEGEGMIFSMECHQLTTMRSAAVIREILDEVDSPAVVANCDPVNLLDSAVAAFDNTNSIKAMGDILVPEGGVPRYGPSCHVKDIRVGLELPLHMDEMAPGEGMIDLGAVFDLAQRLPAGPRGGASLIIEHLGPEASYAGIDLVREAALKHGVELL